MARANQIFALSIESYAESGFYHEYLPTVSSSSIWDIKNVTFAYLFLKHKCTLSFSSRFDIENILV